MILELATAATATSIDLSTARTKLGFQTGITTDDTYVTRLLKQVDAYIEQKTGRKVCAQTWTIGLDYTEVSDIMRLPLCPLISVTSVKTYDDDGTETTVAATNYQVRTGLDPRIALTASGSWPTDMRALDSMLITASFGYTTVPQDILICAEAIMQHLYRTKGVGIAELGDGGPLFGIPRWVDKSLKALRVWNV